MRTVFVIGLRDVMRMPQTDGLPFTKEARRQARYLAMRRGLRYLLEYALVHARSSWPTSEAFEAAHHLTRPELLKNPKLGMEEMGRLSEQHDATDIGEFYAFASDVFHYGIAGAGNALETFIWETPATKVQIALELMSLLTVESNTTMGRSLVEIDQALREALTMLGVHPEQPAGEEPEALVMAGVDNDEEADWTADWMHDDEDKGAHS